jgi:hypothetical protein
MAKVSVVPEVRARGGIEPTANSRHSSILAVAIGSHTITLFPDRGTNEFGRPNSRQ